MNLRDVKMRDGTVYRWGADQIPVIVLCDHPDDGATLIVQYAGDDDDRFGDLWMTEANQLET